MKATINKIVLCIADEVARVDVHGNEGEALFDFSEAYYTLEKQGEEYRLLEVDEVWTTEGWRKGSYTNYIEEGYPYGVEVPQHILDALKSALEGQNGE